MNPEQERHEASLHLTPHPNETDVDFHFQGIPEPSPADGASTGPTDPTSIQPTSYQDHLEQVRRSYCEKAAVETRNEAAIMEESLDQIINFIQANRGHIGGIAYVAVAREGTALVDPKTGSAMDGSGRWDAINNNYYMVLANHLKKLTEAPVNDVTALPPSLAELLGGLGRGRG